MRREVEKLLRGGQDTAVLRVNADVCLHCGERLYSADDVRRFEDIRSKLESHDVRSFRRIGASYQAA